MRVFLLQIDDLDRMQHASKLREKMATVLAARPRIDEHEDRRLVARDVQDPFAAVRGFSALEIAVELGATQ